MIFRQIYRFITATPPPPHSGGHKATLSQFVRVGTTLPHFTETGRSSPPLCLLLQSVSQRSKEIDRFDVDNMTVHLSCPVSSEVNRLIELH